MKTAVVIATVLVATVLAALTTAQRVKQEAVTGVSHLKQNDSGDHWLGNRGYVMWQSFGLPKWAAERTVKNVNQVGDTIILHVNPKRVGESLTVVAYLEYQVLSRDQTEPIEGMWSPVPSSERGTVWGYKSRTAGTVGVWAHSHPESRQPRDFALFLPYEACRLPAGNYFVRYRLKVWYGEELVENIPTPIWRAVRVSQQPYSACEGLDAPCLDAFDLFEPLAPVPEPKILGPNDAPAPKQKKEPDGT